jgi:hypothetical protein
MKIRLKVKPKIPTGPNTHRSHGFYSELARNIVKILREEIKKELYGEAKQDTKDLIRSWRYSVNGEEIRVWSSHHALTGKELDEDIEEDKEEAELTGEELGYPDFKKIIVIKKDGSLEIRDVKARTLDNGDWVFPSQQKSAFLERANKRIMRYIKDQMLESTRKVLHG